MSEHDYWQQLIDINPLAQLEANPPADEQLLADILTEPVPHRRRRPSRWWIVGITGVAAIGAAAYMFLDREPAKDPITITCYSDATTDPASQWVLDSAADPVAACAQVWADGRFGLGDTPRLTACVTDTGIIAVVPGDQQVCANLGYALWNTKVDDDALTIIAFQDELGPILGLTCYPEDAALEIVADQLAKHGLEDWTITSNHNWTAELPCAAPGIDPLTRTVTVGARSRRAKDQDPPQG